MKKFVIYSALTLITYQAVSQTKITRKDLLEITLAEDSISKVNIMEIVLQPSQKAPLHQHPCPVVGYVAEGTLLYQLEGKEPVILQKGEAFYEPSNTHISRFDNASNLQPLKFIAFYLNKGEEHLIELLPVRE